MRIGIIDLGTNSVRFDVHQLGPSGKVRLLHREKIMVRLGQGVFLQGMLDPSAVQRTLHAFLRFKKVAAQYRASKVVAFGTSALREVSDRDSFVQEVRTRTGIDLRVISGSEEAQLIALGILSSGKVGKEKVALVDIGGGSTEISICAGRKVLHSHSFNLGTARLQQLYLKRSPPAASSVDELREYIRGTLSGVMISQRWPRVTKVIGSSGTVRALAKLITGSDDKAFAREKLNALVKKMSGMNTTELLGISGMEAKRVDMILAGAILFDECLRALGAASAEPTELSLRDGILEEEKRIFGQREQSHLALHIPDLFEKARAFGQDPEHLRRVAALGETLFDALRRLHRLESPWRVYLIAAIILRNTGEAINIARHEQHSWYIVMNAELPAADFWETELIAELCRLHEGSKQEPKSGGFADNRSRHAAFQKLLAILRTVDALDTGPETVLKLRRVQLHPRQVRLVYSGKNLTGLESINIEKRAPFFEKVFKRALVVEQD